MSTRVIAVDWSGAKSGGRRKIWLAEMAGGTLQRLESGRNRQELVEHLAEEAEKDSDLIVGFDFAFSLPVWFLEEHGAESGPAMWDMIASEGESWLERCEPPFWGRPGRTKPDLAAHFRQTELAAQSVSGAQPNSVFQIGGAGAVGTGSLRGMPYLADLRRAGFSIWPFDEPALPMVVEIYPRLLTGKLVKSDPQARIDYLEGAFPEFPTELRMAAVSSEDALDAAASAVVMGRNLEDLRSLPVPEDDLIRREGWIWAPVMPSWS